MVSTQYTCGNKFHWWFHYWFSILSEKLLVLYKNMSECYLLLLMLTLYVRYYFHHFIIKTKDALSFKLVRSSKNLFPFQFFSV